MRRTIGWASVAFGCTLLSCTGFDTTVLTSDRALLPPSQATTEDTASDASVTLLASEALDASSPPSNVEAPLVDAGHRPPRADASPPNDPDLTPPNCVLGVTRRGAFEAVPSGGLFRMNGGSQADLILSLAVTTRTPIPLEQTRLELSLRSAKGTTGNIYNRGGPSSRCAPEFAPSGCELLNLNVAAQPLALDPFELEDLPVVAKAVVTLPDGQYCAVEVSGRLRRADSAR